MNAVITPEIKALTMTNAFLFGADDARYGWPFAPEAYFGRREYQVEYAKGFESVRGASEITRQFTNSVNWA